MLTPPKQTRLFAIPAVLALAAASTLGGAKPGVAASDKQLSFYHTHTGKRLDVVFSRNGTHVPEALDDINAFLSDFRTGDAVEIDPELLDLIYDVRVALGSQGAYHVISAYRSPATNEMLRGRSKTSGVAKNSQHTHGKAIDLRLEGVPTIALRDQAIAMQRGGVGYYAKSDFVHIDTGRVRRW